MVSQTWVRGRIRLRRKGEAVVASGVGVAARSMIKPGDIVTDVNQRKVSGPRTFRELLKGANLKKGVLLNLISGNTSRFEILKEVDEWS
jgi:S1-C subfamily serine protease